MKSGLEECFTFLFGMACPFQISTRTSLEFLSVFGSHRRNPNLFRIQETDSEAYEFRQVFTCQQFVQAGLLFRLIT